MKTIAFFGSARKKGRTRGMLDYFLSRLEGEITVIDAYRAQIGPCIDCRNCMKIRSCTIQDEMQNIYPRIDEADLVVFASPIYFHSITSPLKKIVDRCQLYWAGSVRGDRAEHPHRKGVILLTAGAPPFENQFLAAELVLKGVLRDMETECSGIVEFPDADAHIPAEDPGVQAELSRLARLVRGQ